MNSDGQRIKNTLDQARREVNRNRGDLALEMLREIRDEIANAGALEDAEYSLLLAEAYAVRNNPAADSFFYEAENKICALPARDLGLEARAFEHHAKFLMGRRPTEAAEYFRRAKSAAVQMGDKEQTARIEMESTVLELLRTNNPELDQLKMLRRVAVIGDYTSQEQLAAWVLHSGEIESPSNALRYARKRENRDEAYFRNLLESGRMTQR